MTVRDLSARMTELGLPLLPSGITKVEQGQRRVDVDELVALAVALGVNPSRLLLPPDSLDDDVALTPTRSVPGWAAWQWADAFAPLPEHSEDDGYNTEEEIEDFQLHSRPAQVRREQRHPLMLAANNLYYSVRRVLHHATKTPDPTRERADLGLETTLNAARRNLQRVAGELDAVEEQAADDGQR